MFLIASPRPPPEPDVTAGRLRRNRRAGCDRSDPPSSSRSHSGHRSTAGAVTAMTVTGEAPPARRDRRDGRDCLDPARQ
jgi:hypothetical protein